MSLVYRQGGLLRDDAASYPHGELHRDWSARSLSATLAAADASARFIGVDLVRVLGALGVIWLHGVQVETLRPSVSCVRWATPLFSLLAGFFIVHGLRSAASTGLVPYLGKRFKRLYVPFLAWSLVYVALLCMSNAVSSSGSIGLHELIDLWNMDRAGFWVRVLLIGTADHLWFLPFLLIATLLLTPVLSPFVSGRLPAAAGAAACVAAAGVTAWMLSGQDIALNNSPLFRAPALLLGVALGLVCHRGWPLIRQAALPVVGVAAAAGTAAWMFMNSYDVLFATIGAVGMVCLAIYRWPSGLGRVVTALGPLTFGAYLAHVPLHRFMLSTANAAGLTPSVGLDLLRIAACVVGSFAIAAVLRRCAWTRWLSPN